MFDCWPIDGPLGDIQLRDGERVLYQEGSAPVAWEDIEVDSFCLEFRIFSVESCERRDFSRTG